VELRELAGADRGHDVQLEGRVGVREAGALKSGSFHGATSHDQFIEQFHETASYSVFGLGQIYEHMHKVTVSPENCKPFF
jgi:hypothetical protein